MFFQSNIRELNLCFALFCLCFALLCLGQVGQGVVTRIGRFSVQTLLDTPPGLGTQPRYEAPGDPQVGIVKTQ